MAISEMRDSFYGMGRSSNNLYQEYPPGDQISFPLHTLQSDGNIITSERSITIEDIRGGGFFGKVIIPQNENFVIKTSLPDPWHHLWRIVNWNFREFPAQSEEKSAKLEHLATRLIHDVLPVVSGGKFYSPDSYGYTRLAPGYAQVVEKINGRGPRFDLPKNEYLQFRRAQQDLLKIGYELGLEQVGQIHPDNPFGMANLWLDESQNRWIWLDTIPAIRHTGLVWPLFYFGFHNDVRREFKADQPTFNRIHSDRFIATLYRFRGAFSREKYKEIMADLALYDNLLREEKMAQARDGRDMKAAADAFSATVEDVITERFIYKIIASPSFRKEKLETLMKVLKDPIYRAYFINKNVILSGIERARKEGLIGEKEIKEAWQAVENDQSCSAEDSRRKVVYTGLQTYYIVTGQIINLIEGSTYLSALFAEDKLARLSLGLFIGWILPSILRPVSTLIIDKATNVDLRAAAAVSIVPKIGSYTGVIAQIGVSGGNKTEKIWHYTVRNIIAALSSISPSGGWGTQLEAQLWNLLGKRLEALGKQEIDINSK